MEEVVMSQSTSSPMRASASKRAVRQVWVYLLITYAITLGLALALPHSELAPLLTIFAPVTAVALTILITLPHGQRRAAWASVGFGVPAWRALILAVVVPAIVVGLSFGIAAAIGVISFPKPGPGLALGVLEALVTTLIFGVVFLGEEIGWRGFLLLRLCELMPGRSAALLTGACHAIFHVPLLTLTTTYQYAGSRWIVVPMVMVTITLAGVWYAWLRLRFGTIWPVSLSHSAFNHFMETVGGVAIVTSPAAMAYTTTETGFVTMIIVLALAVYLLTRRAKDFTAAK
jgi:membrane protease YdiL (CAAX protease family)